MSSVSSKRKVLAYVPLGCGHRPKLHTRKSPQHISINKAQLIQRDFQQQQQLLKNSSGNQRNQLSQNSSPVGFTNEKLFEFELVFL